MGNVSFRKFQDEESWKADLESGRHETTCSLTSENLPVDESVEEKEALSRTLGSDAILGGLSHHWGSLPQTSKAFLITLLINAGLVVGFAVQQLTQVVQ
jgi:hypothetical protein